MSILTHKYNPAEISDAELEATFAARGHTVDYLLKALRDQTRSDTLSSFVITGPRGAGKSTVLRMVALRIKQDAGLSAAWMPVLFPEEQFQITSLRDLLAATLKVLASQAARPDSAWLERVECEPNDEQSQQLAITGLRETTRALNRRLVLFIENLNLLFEEGLSGQEKGGFRRLLMIDPFMMVVGSAVHVFASLRRYDQAFFNYFGEVRLDRLNAEQVFELLALRATYDNNERFRRAFPQNESKVRAMVHLSGGNPRLILMLYELLSQKQVTTVVQQLLRLVDELTPLLKEEMERLPPQQRKIIHALMEKGGTAQPTDLVAPTRLKLNTITEQLRRLKQAQILDVLGGGKGRAAFYTVPDQLFSIWYQMRYLRQNRRRIELLVEVLRIWFEAQERFETIRNLQTLVAGTGPATVRDSATTSEYFAATLIGTAFEVPARDLALQTWLRTGDIREAAMAIADFNRVKADNSRDYEAQAYASLGDWSLAHDDARSAVQALAEATKTDRRPEVLLRYGFVLGSIGHYAKALDQFDAVVAAAHDSVNLLSTALLARGVVKRDSGDHAGANVEFTAVVELDGAPNERVATALANRGVLKGNLGDHAGAIADFTAAVELEGAPRDQVAIALFNRALAKANTADPAGAIADYSAVVELEGAPTKQVAMGLVGRGTAKANSGDPSGAIADYSAVIAMRGIGPEQRSLALESSGVSNWGAVAKYDSERAMRFANASSDSAVAAALGLVQLHWIAGRRENAFSALDLIKKLLGNRSDLEKQQHIVRVLSVLGRPAFREAWPHAWRRLANGQPPAVEEALAFFRPVVEVLEQRRTSLPHSLSPEHREFAREIVDRINADVLDSRESTA